MLLSSSRGHGSSRPWARLSNSAKLQRLAGGGEGACFLERPPPFCPGWAANRVRRHRYRPLIDEQVLALKAASHYLVSKGLRGLVPGGRRPSAG